jgi:hypothetical protein
MPPRPRRKPPDPFATLRRDHRRIRGLFREFVAAHRAGAVAARALVALVATELELHARLEAAVFYPAARGLLDDEGGRAIDAAEVEHDLAATLVARLAALPSDDRCYAATVAVLAKSLRAHFRDEERGILARLRGSGHDLAALGAQLRAHRARLTAAPDTPGQLEPSLDAAGADEPSAAEALRRGGQ